MRAGRAVFAVAVAGELLVLFGALGGFPAWVLAAISLGGIAAAAFCLRAGFRWGWAMAILPLIVLAAYPPIAFDETLYHLPFVRSLATTARIAFLPELRFAIFPQLHELFCVGPYLAFGDVATHFVSLMELALLGALVVAWPEDRNAGLLAAALCLGHPIVVQLATVTYVDVALTLFVAAGFYFTDHDKPAAAGFLFAAACSTKYLGWYFAGGGLAFLLFFNPRRGRAVAIFLAAFVPSVLPMYARILYEAGSPVFPFLPTLFGTTAWTMLQPRPEAPLEGALRLFWDITFARQRFNWQAPYSPVFAVAVLVVIAAAFRDRRAAFVAVLTAGYITIFNFLPQDSRYLLPLLPLVSVTAAAAIAPRLSKRVVLAVSLIAIAPAAAYAGYRIARQGPPPVTAGQRRRYLEEHIPEYRAMERRSAEALYVCGGEQLRYYAGPRVAGDFFGLFDEPRVIGGSATSAELAQRLRATGARQFLVSRRRCPDEWQRIPAAPQFDLVYADESATLWRIYNPPREPRRSDPTPSRPAAD